jgi:hypothetical protein
MKKVIGLLILFLTINLYSQSPWTKKKGAFYTQLSFTTIPGYDTLFGNPDYNTERKTTDNTFQFYGEYGLFDKTTLIINLPLKLIKTNELVSLAAIPSFTSKGEKSTLGNVEIGIKHNFYNKNWLISGQVSVEANTSSFDNTTGIRTGYDAWTVTPIILAGKSYGKNYLQGFIGADVRTNNYSSSFKIGGEVGRKITKNIWLVGYVNVLKSFKNGAIILPNSNIATGLYVNDQEFGGFGLKVIGEFTEKFGITAGFGGAFFATNLPKQAALSFGLYHKF